MKRKRYAEKQLISIPKEHEAGASVPVLSRRLSVAENTIYRWKSKSAGMEVSETKCLGELQGENANLKHVGQGSGIKAALKRAHPGNRVTGAQRHAIRGAPDEEAHQQRARISAGRVNSLGGTLSSVARYRLKARG